MLRGTRRLFCEAANKTENGAKTGSVHKLIDYYLTFSVTGGLGIGMLSLVSEFENTIDQYDLNSRNISTWEFPFVVIKPIGTLLMKSVYGFAAGTLGCITAPVWVPISYLADAPKIEIKWK